jgi:hypothetical protein
VKSKNGKTTGKTHNLWLIIVAVLALGGIIWLSVEVTDDSASAPAASIARAEIETLPPDMFTGQTREAYQAAKDIPEVLEQVPCYCGCMKNSGHQHNLHCFVDNHGAT